MPAVPFFWQNRMKILGMADPLEDRNPTQKKETTTVRYFEGFHCCTVLKYFLFYLFQGPNSKNKKRTDHRLPKNLCWSST